MHFFLITVVCMVGLEPRFKDDVLDVVDCVDSLLSKIKVGDQCFFSVQRVITKTEQNYNTTKNRCHNSNVF